VLVPTDFQPAIVWTLTFGIGRLGDPSIPLGTRVYAAQTALLALCACTLVVSALFTVRRHHVTSLEAHKASLADALAAGRVMAFDWNAVTGRSRRSDNAASILGIEDNQGSRSARNDFFKQVHPDDQGSVKAKIRQLSPGNPSYALTFRFCPPNDAPIWLEETAKGEFDTTGGLLRIKGLTRNITERKQAELVLEERNIQVALAEKATLVGSFAYDIDTEIMRISQGYAAIHGLHEGTTEIARSQCLADVHSDDIGWVEQVRSVGLKICSSRCSNT
jgi:PAS domain-containing protein